MWSSELKRYKSALNEIAKKYKQPHPYKKHMRYGFCAYFEHRVGLFRERKYPVLWSLRPDKSKTCDSFWFKEGDWGPRIQLLQKAIKIIEDGN